MDDSAYLYPDISRLEREIDAMRDSLTLIVITVEKIYNVVKIIYWDNHRSPQPGTEQTRLSVRAVAKAPDLLRHVLAKSYAKAAARQGAFEGAALDLLTGSPRKQRPRDRPERHTCRVAYDLLATTSSTSACAEGSLCTSREIDHSLEWAKILPRILDLGSTDSKGDHDSRNLQQLTTLHEIPEEYESTADIVALDDYDESVTPPSLPLPRSDIPAELSTVQVAGTASSIGADNSADPVLPVCKDVSQCPDSPPDEVKRSDLVERWGKFLSGAKFSPLRLPEGPAAEDDFVDEISGKVSTARAAGEEPCSSSPIPGQIGVVSEVARVVDTCTREGRKYVLVHYQCLMEQMLSDKHVGDNLRSQSPDESAVENLQPAPRQE